LNVVLATNNEDDPVHVDTTDRRYEGHFVYSDPYVNCELIKSLFGDKIEYFNSLFKKLPEDSLKTLLNFFYNADVSKFEPDMPFQSNVLNQVRLFNMDPMRYFIIKMIKSGKNHMGMGDGNHFSAWEPAIQVDEMHRIFDRVMKLDYGLKHSIKDVQFDTQQWLEFTKVPTTTTTNDAGIAVYNYDFSNVSFEEFKKNFVQFANIQGLDVMINLHNNREHYANRVKEAFPERTEQEMQEDKWIAEERYYNDFLPSTLRDKTDPLKLRPKPEITFDLDVPLLTLADPAPVNNSPPRPNSMELKRRREELVAKYSKRPKPLDLESEE
jgi:hypothetical protein